MEKITKESYFNCLCNTTPNVWNNEQNNIELPIEQRLEDLAGNMVVRTGGQFGHETGMEMKQKVIKQLLEKLDELEMQ